MFTAFLLNLSHFTENKYINIVLLIYVSGKCRCSPLRMLPAIRTRTVSRI